MHNNCPDRAAKNCNNIVTVDRSRGFPTHPTPSTISTLTPHPLYSHSRVQRSGNFRDGAATYFHMCSSSCLWPETDSNLARAKFFCFFPLHLPYSSSSSSSCCCSLLASANSLWKEQQPSLKLVNHQRTPLPSYIPLEPEPMLPIWTANCIRNAPRNQLTPNWPISISAASVGHVELQIEIDIWQKEFRGSRIDKSL